MPGALDGVIVADFTQMMQGGWASQKLGDLGADIIKIEPPGGEYERPIPSTGELSKGISIKFLVMNRNKRSIAIDLKTDEGHQIALDIIKKSDILMENFRPGVMERLNLGYEDVKETNPEIIYVSASGYGSDGPYADRPGQDLLIQAETGLASITGRRHDPPTPNGTTIADELSANLIALHTITALFHKERTGEGQKVEGNLVDSLIDGLCQEYATKFNHDVEFDRGVENHGNIVSHAPYGIYEASDGHIAISHASMEQLEDVFGIDLSGYDSAKSLYDHRDEIHEKIENYTRDHPAEELVEAMREDDLWVTRVRDLHEAKDHPQMVHNNSFIEVEHPHGGEFTMPGFPVSLSKTPGELRHRPPLAGEQSREILSEMEYNSEEIDALIGDEIVSVED